MKAQIVERKRGIELLSRTTGHLYCPACQTHWWVKPGSNGRPPPEAFRCGLWGCKKNPDCRGD